MHLKRLELAGFKTFADRTALEFSSRITGIVGPNGSGKSNIFDAIRWALGEGSVRAVRGVRGEDVIFAGSDRRRPLGMAEVTLTLDNADGTLVLPPEGEGQAATPLAFSEVTVTRRAFRGADSQYFVNGVPCRLRDIQTLFLGTGLGGHSYALISQGEVDRMLDATPEERRMILEEAAGVAKYKRRRHEAERRLAAVAQLMERVEDILREQEAQVAQLEAQAEAADRHQAYTRELRSLELALQVEGVRRLLRTERRIRDQLAQLASRRRDADEALRALDAEREALERRRTEASAEWEAAQRSLVALAEQRASREARVQRLEERARAVASRRVRLREDGERVAREEAALADEEAALRRALRALEEERERHGADAEAAQGTLGEAEAEVRDLLGRLGELRAGLWELHSARARAAETHAALEARAAACRDRLGGVEMRLRQLEEARGTSAEEHRSLLAELSRLDAEVESDQGEREALRAEAARARRELEAVEGALRRRELDREALRSRVAYLEDAQAQYRGYEAGARAVLLARRADPERFRAVRCAVADILHAPRDLRRALGAALGSASSALVVGEPAHVAEVAASLGEEEAVTLFVPPLAPPARSAPECPGRDDPGVVGFLLDQVTAEPGCEEVARSLLGDVLVVADLAAALRLRAAGYGGRIVTLSGESVGHDGLVRVGRQSAAGGPVGRADEIREARQALAHVDAEVQGALGRVEEAARRLREAEGRVAEVEERLRERAERRADLERRCAVAEAAVAHVADALGAAQEERAALLREMRDVEGALRDAEREAEALAHRVSGVEEEIARVEARLQEGTARAGAARDRVTAARLALAALEERGEGLRRQAEEVEGRLAQTRARRRELEEEGELLDREAAQVEGELQSARDQCRELAEEVSRLEERLRALDGEREALAATREELERRRREAAEAAQAVGEEAHRVEMRQAQVGAEIASARQRIEEEFGRPADQAMEEVPPSVARDEVLGRIETLRQLLADLGPVNLRAIEEHRLASARAAALREQHGDVAGALGTLKGLIADLEAVIRQKFDETYRAVSGEFGALFARLFGGGKAGLEMVTVEGSEETGVDIVVQPPGRALRSLQALSGGERVLVALALAFAMLRVRPSPFCVFDEVEAALDEPNTRKIAELLRELAEQSQVIIITHNKATMEACDVLFGVTTEEPGVSHLVSVRLHDREEAAVG